MSLSSFLTNLTAFKSRLRPARSLDDAPFPSFEDARSKTPDFEPEACIEIPVKAPSPVQAQEDKLREHGQRMARQDAWLDLARALGDADVARKKTAALSPVATLLAQGARSDLVTAAAQALSVGEIRKVRAAIATLEINLEDGPECQALHQIAALAHLDLAKAWRNGPLAQDLRGKRRGEMFHHFTSAATYADMFDPFETDSPGWAMIRCGLLDHADNAAARVCDDYEDLIDLDPTCPAHMSALGRDILPTRFGSYAKLDLEARRTAARQSDLWGSGGYTWVFIGALEHDRHALKSVDAGFFVEGLHDILDRHPDQHMVNRLAAFCGYTMAGRCDDDSAQARIARCFDWLVQDHLRELYPVLWANAAGPVAPRRMGVAETDTAARGQGRAMAAFAALFDDALTSGKRAIFDPAGIRFERMA